MKVYIGLGSNLGDRRWYIEQALWMINPARISSIYETEPLDMGTDLKFYNLAAEMETDMNPEELLRYLLDIEKKLGRDHKGEKRPRTIDLDILLYEDKIVALPFLKIPHPEIEKRSFVLQPLAELIPDVNIPGREITVAGLLTEYNHEKSTVFS